MTREEYGAAYKNGFSGTVRLLQRNGLTPNRAEEIAQDAWGRGWERIDSLKDDNRIQPWVNSIALNMLRSDIRKDRMTSLSYIGTDVVQCSGGQKSEDKLDVHLILQMVSPAAKRFIIMRYLLEHDDKTIASLENYTRDSVRMRIFHELHKIRKILRRQKKASEIKRLFRNI